MRYQKGWTLVELIIAIAIFTIITGVSFSYFRYYPTFSNLIFSDQLINLMRYGQSVAKASHCEVKLDIDDNHQVRLFQQRNCTGDYYPLLLPYTKIPEGISLTHTLPLYFQVDTVVLDPKREIIKEQVINLKNKKITILGHIGMVREDVL